MIKYKSTRGYSEEVLSAQAIKKGLAPDGGLYMPTSVPKIDLDFIKKLGKLDYSGRAKAVLGLFLTDYSDELLTKICSESYSAERFTPAPAPLVKLDENMSVLELWHGPTAAFKDMALQIMPRLLSAALDMTGEKKTALILVATSGDTGKAALEGYRDVDGIKIMVYYPENGVSDIQKLQMASQEGENVNVIAIKGNFDDAQTGVKQIFTDKTLELQNAFLSSANSINWGRLAPQIVYYFSGYCDMVSNGTVALGEAIDVCVPTGNFGNIFAACIAKEMGLPINKFICASNKNNILTDFFKSGVYDKNRDFYTTVSPSMDILISSNLERLLYLVAGSEKTAAYMRQLNEKGRYEIDASVKEKLDKLFAAGCTDEENTAKTIKYFFEKFGYLADTHTAVALNVTREYLKDNPTAKVMTVSTASPYKFAADVLASLVGDSAKDMSAFDAIDELCRISGKEIPLPLASLKGKRYRFTKSVDKEDMKKEVIDFAK